MNVGKQRTQKCFKKFKLVFLCVYSNKIIVMLSLQVNICIGLNRMLGIGIGNSKTQIAIFLIIVRDLAYTQLPNGVAVEFESDHQDQQRLRLQNIAGELIAVGIYDAERRTVR